MVVSAAAARVDLLVSCLLSAVVLWCCGVVLILCGGQCGQQTLFNPGLIGSNKTFFAFSLHSGTQASGPAAHQATRTLTRRLSVEADLDDAMMAMQL